MIQSEKGIYDEIQNLLDKLSHTANKNQLEKLVHQKLDHLPGQAKPYLLHLAGIPGAGKSTYCNQILQGSKNELSEINIHRNNTFYLSFDEIMESLPGYTKISCPTEAFKKFEQPAAALGYGLLANAIFRNLNILFDHSAAKLEHLELCQLLKTAGIYQLKIHYIASQPSITSQRTKAREALTGRHTPLALIHDRHKLLLELIPKYQSIVDEFKIIELKRALNED